MVTRLAVVALLVAGAIAIAGADAEARDRRTPRYCGEVVARVMVGGPCHTTATRQERREWRRGLKSWRGPGERREGPSWLASR